MVVLNAGSVVCDLLVGVVLPLLEFGASAVCEPLISRAPSWEFWPRAHGLLPDTANRSASPRTLTAHTAA